MAETINTHNIGAYLAHLARKLQQPLPVPYNRGDTFAGKSPSEIGVMLEDLYARLGLPNQTGWSLEDAFLKEAAQEPPAASAFDPAPVAVTAYQYLPVATGIGRGNFRPFLYWVEERLKRPLDLFGIGAWDNFNDEAVRNALPGIYQSAGIPPDDAKQLELGFLAVYHQKVAPVPVVLSSPPPAAPRPVAPVVNPAPQTTTTGIPQQQPPRRKRRLFIPLIIGLFAVGLIGFWLFQKYAAYAKQPLVYALTNNIALRRDASDSAPIAGRMDIYGQYLDGKGVKQASASSLKLTSEELNNNFYKANTGSSFWGYLTGSDSIVYVHNKYVTTDKAVYEKYSDDLSALRNDYNELDKLGFIYRQMIGRAVLKNSEGTAIKIAASCRPSPKLSKIAPLSIGKYRNKANGELDVFIQATDGFCYVLRGGENELPPTITPVVIQYGLYNEPMKSGGMLTKQGANGGLRFEYCTEGQVFFSQPPYTVFLPLPVPIQAPADPVDVEDNPAVPMDTASAGF